MDDESAQARWGRRLQVVLGAGLVLFGLYGMLDAAGSGDAMGMLPYYVMSALGAFFLAPIIATRIAEPLGRAVYGGKKGVKIKPDLSIPLAHRKFDRYDQAMEALETIVQETPDHLDAWVEMVDIALSDLEDPERARMTLHRGLRALSDPEDRERLAQAYKNVSEQVARRTAARAGEAPQTLEFPDDLP